MLSRPHRLTAKKDFARLFSKGRSFGSKALGMKAGRNGLEVTRVGFVVSAKVSKKAVVRNRIKRRMRQAMRELLPEVASGYDIAFMARSGTVDLSQAEIKVLMGRLLRQARLVCAPKV
ncbi:hypothetical protein AMJ57_05230 [Parcubacteria bacterium SG8_24]|nr:MAG: hypothetical protein AMJ57_05230 [Parcubacteria bacterium SG8_24]